MAAYSERDYKDEKLPEKNGSTSEQFIQNAPPPHQTLLMPHAGAHFESRHLSRRFQSETADGANTAGVSELSFPLSGDSDDNPSTPIDYLHHHPVETQRASHYPRVNTSESNVISAWANTQEKTRHLETVSPRRKDWWVNFHPCWRSSDQCEQVHQFTPQLQYSAENKWQFLQKFQLAHRNKIMCHTTIADNHHSNR